MNSQRSPSTRPCPPARDALLGDARASFEDLLRWCLSCDSPFAAFEMELLVRLAAVARCLVRLFLAARHERLDLQPFLADGSHRPGDPRAVRSLKTFHGEVSYARQYLTPRAGGAGFFPLDVVLGLTRDRLSPWVMQWVARLATRMSFQAARMTCKAVLNWAPATETIEQVVLGMGRDAAPFLRQHPAATPKQPDGEVLVIEIDGKCPPTATAGELAKRRGKRRPRHASECPCGCQRHRGRTARAARGSRPRRRRGDKSKNGKEVLVVVMYTLKRGGDGKLHGPLNKKLYATFAGRRAAAAWARAEATRRGFEPGTKKTVQILMDGAKGLRNCMKPLFPRAILTLDVCHVVEKLWTLGRHFHKEGSEELKAWVGRLKELVYAGKAKELTRRLRTLLDEVSRRGPGTKARRAALQRLIGYLEPRRSMMRYGRWRGLDLVIATGQVEGAVRHLVGERLDGAGMRWIQGRAEALLHLRCIELNGDWPSFVEWYGRRTRERLATDGRSRILTNKPLPLAKAA